MENVHRNDETDSVVLRHSDTQADSAPIPQHHIKNANPDEEYSMNHEKRGIAVVINQERFKDEKDPTRHGTNKDRDDVCAVLKNLQFEVKVLNDRTKLELFKTLDEISKLDHTNHDCLVVVVMTHGDPDKLYTKDGSYVIDELWNKFTGDSCTTLRGKPKLFFIQACSYQKLNTKECDAVDAHDTSKTKRPTYTIPTMANLLVMYSTYDGYKPWRDTSNGSWFIQSLCAVLNSHGHNKELLRVLAMVLRKVEENYRQFVPHSEKRNALKKLPCVVSMLTKALYFRPKPMPDSNDLNDNPGFSNAIPTPRKHSRREPPPSYTMQNMQQKAYIFLNQTFDECLNGKFLNSGIKDADELKSALIHLGFTVDDSSKDLKLCEWKEKMNSIASENHEDTGCILFAIITCGKDNLLFVQDDTYSVPDLLDQFSNSKCPTLSSKPKVFLIQARTESEREWACSNRHEDVLVMYSSYNTITDRNEQPQLTPTDFIQTLCDEFYANGKILELSSMLESVRLYIANNNNPHNQQDPADGDSREANNPMPILVSMLSKKLYFD
ncbi:uncharacterized protein LOC126579021 [Anopheles aquasalis]|uniref:uncharacterized protein LOC126579021 n=1 Tax=Anopheles aquasalis TaxID=42839 RepID=UPI00215B46D2|nr:uncharacterized protein LOC126579021 [Anopheles aquasalis]